MLNLFGPNRKFRDRTLLADGLKHLGIILNQTQIEEIQNYFKGKNCYAYFNETDAQDLNLELMTTDKIKKSSHYACYGSYDLYRAPHILKLANDERVLSYISAYLKENAQISGISCWWSFADKGAAPLFQAQQLHRDPSTNPFCCLFVYLSDVSYYTGGPHVYVAGSHDPNRFRQILSPKVSAAQLDKLIELTYYKDGYGADLEGLLSNKIRSSIYRLTGRAGSAFITDPVGLHKGEVVHRKDRLMLSVRYQPETKKLIQKYPPAIIEKSVWDKADIKPAQRKRFSHLISTHD